MAEPQLSEEQIAAIKEAKRTADFGIEDAIRQQEELQKLIEIQEDLDSGLAVLQGYNDFLIQQYEEERARLTGLRTQNPISQSDYDQFVNLQPGARLGTNLIPQRIPQFDLNPTATTESVSELVQINRQSELDGYLVSGFTYPEPQLTAETAIAVNNSSTSLTTEPTTSSFGIVIGQWLLISSGSSAGVLKVASVNQPNFPYVSGSTTVNFSWIVPPNTTIPSGAILNGSFPGFNNAERSSKTSATRQRLMDQWVSDLQQSLQTQSQSIDLEISAINSNDNERLDRSSVTKANNHKAAIAAYLGASPPSTMSISDAGLSVLRSINSNRRNEINARVSQISYELSNGPKGSFLDRRYDLVVSRYHLGNGSYRILLSLQKTKNGAGDKQAISQSLSDRWASFL
jgi:hypothetical protein